MEKLTREEKQILLTERIAELMEQNGGIVKTAQLYTLDLDYRKIQCLVEKGVIQRVKNGYYSMHFEEKSEESIIEGLFPDGVLCMDSALYYYHYLDVKPYCWHIAVDKNTSKSRFKMEYPLVQPYYTEPEVLKLGVEEVPMGDGTMHIYNKERLICDCLKYDIKLEHDVFKHALRSYINESQKDLDRLMEYAHERKVVQKVQNMIGVWL